MRDALWEHLAETIENYARGAECLPVSPRLDPAALRRELAKYSFEEPMDARDAVDAAAHGLRDHQVHTAHPMYFGLFNPAPSTMGIAADALVAAYNPQIAAWSHNPYAAEVENHLLRQLGAKFGLDPSSTDGVFCSGGMEANHTALLTALCHAAPGFPESGTRSLSGQPVMYVSSEGHHSLLRAASVCGIGRASVRLVEVDEGLRMRPSALESALDEDSARGNLPFLIAATAGTTSAGAIDPLPELAAIARSRGIWFHTDAAWGGAAALVPELRPLLNGIELSDSITFDAHKWMSVPMGAGLYLTRDTSILSRTFQLPTHYMPKEAAGLDVVDPHQHSMQWSRRFIGLKVFLTLLVAGWNGYAETIRHQTEMGALLRRSLSAAGWEVVNRTELPVVCFRRPGWDDAQHHELAMRVVGSGSAWISSTVLGRYGTVLRACITNYMTGEQHVTELVRILSE